MVQVLVYFDDYPPAHHPPPFLPPTRHLVVAHHGSCIDFQEKGNEMYCLEWFAWGPDLLVCIEERQHKAFYLFHNRFPL